MLDYDLIQQQWKEEDEFERIYLEFMDALIVGWRIINNSTEISNADIASFHDLTLESLIYCWGDGSKIDFEKDKIIFIHSSGEKVEKSLNV
jgi:hypothetical protein